MLSLFNHGIDRINILLICLIPIMIIISIAFRTNVEQISENDLKSDYNLKSDPKLNGLRKYCNFLDDIQIGDENSFNYCGYDLELEKIIILIRHGDRGPLKDVRNLNNIPCNHTHLDEINRINDEQTMAISTLLSKFIAKSSVYDSKFLGSIPMSDGCMPGLLTKFGLSQHIKLGLLMNRVYRPKLNMNPDDSFIAKQIRINTTPYPRTVQSAMAFLHGFLSEKNDALNVFDLMSTNFHQFSNVYFCDYHDTQKYCFRNCTEMDELLKKIYKTFSYDHDKDFAQMIKQVEQIIVPTNVADPIGSYKRSIVSIFDTLNSFICHQQRLPCHQQNDDDDDDYDKCIAINDVELIFTFISGLGHKLMHSEDNHRISWMQSYGLLLNLIDQIKSNEKLTIFSGHDLTIHSLATVIGFVEHNIPPYASRVIFEIYSRKSSSSTTTATTINNEKLIRIVYNGNDVTETFPLCNSIYNDAASAAADAEHCIRFDDDDHTILIKLTSLENFIHTKFVEHYLFENC
ncbi:2-phosphoxylose phosphatase 1 [Dermatophagoides farinae]|uniref:2-phosphoxylose phosphatase 1 n=1 Tax=Dermatophagoides farinae TaxID=6954 RepID=A0A922HT02_DERFA|nr:2-phosphoxylose phosphatase 1 [Dermatophagoides farinae]